MKLAPQNSIVDFFRMRWEFFDARHTAVLDQTRRGPFLKMDAASQRQKTLSTLTPIQVFFVYFTDWQMSLIIAYIVNNQPSSSSATFQKDQSTREIVAQGVWKLTKSTCGICISWIISEELVTSQWFWTVKKKNHQSIHLFFASQKKKRMRSLCILRKIALLSLNRRLLIHTFRLHLVFELPFAKSENEGSFFSGLGLLLLELLR